MNLELYFDRIEQYESGALTEPERADMERELLENADLRQALALYRQTNEAIELHIENNLRNQLQEWAAAEAPQTRGRIVTMKTVWVRWAAAAAVALLLGWVGFRWAGTQYNDPALFVAYYEKPADSAFRAGTGADHPLQPGFEALQNNRLVEAAAFFSAIPAGNERYAEAQYYLGHATLQQQQYDAALTAFANAASSNETKWRDKAEWNRLLTFLAAGRTTEPAFANLLNQVADAPDHSFAKPAKALRAKLGSVFRQ